jgi:outer membrane protein OmpA-like peptidoglycan-associated protein
MIKRFDLRATRWTAAVLAIGATLAITGPAAAQNTNAAKPRSAVSVEGGYSTFDFSVFAGADWYQFGQGTTNSVNKFDRGISWGERFTEDFSKYLAFEEGTQVNYNHLLLRPLGAPSFASVSSGSTSVYGDVVLHLTPREAKYRPFILVGPEYVWYRVSNFQNIKAGAGTPTPISIGSPPQNTARPGLDYGIGLKMNISPRFGARFDLRGLRSTAAHFGLPAFPAGPNFVYIPAGGHESSLTASVGIVFRLHYHEPPAPPAPAPPPPPPPAPVANIQVGAITGAKDVCSGDSVSLQVEASGWLPDQTPAYQWMVNGAPVSGATSSTFSVPTADGSGARRISVQVSAGGVSKTSSEVVVNIRTLAPPTVQFGVSPSTVPYGTKITLAATGNGSDCGGAVTIRYAGDGVTGNVFDSTALSFDQTNRLRQQSKTVHITATATDQKNQTANAGADVTVTLTAQARRLDDIVFPVNSSRVNNCAKRLLLEELTPMLRSDPDAKVVLIGHRDTAEKGRASAKLDDARVINSAAVLSAGKGICPSLDLSRIRVNSVGTEQSSETRPSLCGTSTNVKEKGGQAVKESDKRAQYRRVEVWIIPGGADMPAGMSGLKDAPAKDIQAKGCPR